MFEVFIEENSHYADEDSRLKIGDFENFEDALNACKKVVDDFLSANYKQGMIAEELFRLYTMFGEDAFIGGESTGGYFRAWEYAEERCRKITRIQF